MELFIDKSRAKVSALASELQQSLLLESLAHINPRGPMAAGLVGSTFHRTFRLRYVSACGSKESSPLEIESTLLGWRQEVPPSMTRI